MHGFEELKEVVSGSWGHLFLGEPLSSGTYLGGSLVLLASALVSGFNPWRKVMDLLDARP